MIRWLIYMILIFRLPLLLLQQLITDEDEQVQAQAQKTATELKSLASLLLTKPINSKETRKE